MTSFGVLQLKELVPYEEDLIKLVKNIKFRKVDNRFQRTLAKDLKDIQSSKKSANCSRQNFKYVSPQQRRVFKPYSKFYYIKIKKTDKNTATNINKGGIKHAKEVSIINRIEINGTGNSFITLKDHKENFLNRPTTRLLQPAKNEIGRLSKHILQNITLSEKIKVNEWKIQKAL